MRRWHLHELTREHGACGIRAVLVGGWGAGGCRAGQLRGGQYVCSMRWRITGVRKACRRAALAWGYWAQRSGMTEHLDAADTARMQRAAWWSCRARTGFLFLIWRLRGSAPLLVPTRLDLRSLSAAGESLPPLLQGLVRRQVACIARGRRLGSSSAWPGCPQPSASGCCSSWCAARPRRC